MKNNNFEMIRQLVLESSINTHHANRYLRLVKNFLIRGIKKNRKMEGFHGHHILPRSIFPEHAKDPWNKVVVTPREHYLLHWILSYSHGKSMIQAFFQMSIHPKYNIRITARQYEAAKLRHAKDMGQRKFYELDGKMRRLYDDDPDVMSGRAIASAPPGPKNPAKFMKGRVPVYDTVLDKTTSVTKEEVDYERYVPLGLRRSEESRNKTSKALSNRMHAYHKDSKKRIFVKPGEIIPDGYIVGIYGNSEAARKIFTGRKHAYNPITRETGRHTEETLPEGWVFGRIDFDNSFSGKVPMINHLTGERFLHQVGEDIPEGCAPNTSKYVYLFCCPDSGRRLYSMSIDRLIKASGALVNKSYITSTADLDFKFSKGKNKGETPRTLGFDRFLITEWKKDESYEWV